MFYVTVVVKNMLKERRLWSKNILEVDRSRLSSHDKEIYDFMMAVISWEDLDDIDIVVDAKLVLEKIANDSR